MIDHVKSFGKINCSGQCVEDRLIQDRLILKNKSSELFYVKGRRAVNVEWLGRKSCWLGEKGSEFSFGCRRRSRTLAAGQRREIGSVNLKSVS